MMKNYYNVLTLDANSLMLQSNKTQNNGRGELVFNVDNSNIIHNNVFKATSLEDDNALFRQMRILCENNPGSFDAIDKSNAIDYFIDKIVTVDFNNFFDGKDIKKFTFNMRGNLDDIYNNDKINSNEAKIFFLFLNGFNMTYNGKQSHMVPFQVSNSNSRSSKVLFVTDKLLPYHYEYLNSEEKDAISNEELQKIKDNDLLNRILLNYDFVGHNTLEFNSLIKYYAYRGLMFSGGTACNIYEKSDKNIPLINKDSFVIVDDYCEKVKVPVFSISDEELNDGIDFDSKHFNNGEIHLNKYDGEGLCSKEFASYLSQQFDSTNKHLSFQFRMPFCKGVLHTIDYKEIIASYFSHSTSFDSIYIKDAWGIPRQLSKIEVILTKSQFKFYKYIDKYYKKAANIDPMEEYFKYFYKYEHCIHILSTNASGKSTNKVNFNYQYLLTTPIEKAVLFDELITPQMTALYGKDGQAAEIICDENGALTDENPYINDLISKNKYISKNLNFLGISYFKDILKSNKQSYLKGISCGRLAVDGSFRLLARDIVALLLDLIRNSVVVKEGSDFNKLISFKVESVLSKQEGSDTKEQLSTNEVNWLRLTHHLMYSHKFFSPNLPTTDDCALYRNPHYSRNEIALLSPYSPSDKKSKVTLFKTDSTKDSFNFYKKYSSIDGVAFLAKSSSDANRLGGADFDGDEVKIIYQKQIVDSLKKHFKLNDSKPDYLSIYKAKNPVANIDGGKNNNEQCQHTITKEYSAKYCKTYLPYILQSFYDYVGIFSNRAFKIGYEEYQLKEKEFKNITPLGTILNGLIIDFAKTSYFPDECIKSLNDYYMQNSTLATKRPTGSAKYDFLSLCSKSGRIKNFDFKKNYKKDCENFPEQINFGDKIMSLKKYDEVNTTIDSIPTLFRDYIELASTPFKLMSKNSDGELCAFSPDKKNIFEFPNELIDNSKNEQIADLIKSYKQVNTCLNRYMRMYSSLNTSSELASILIYLISLRVYDINNLNSYIKSPDIDSTLNPISANDIIDYISTAIREAAYSKTASSSQEDSRKNASAYLDSLVSKLTDMNAEDNDYLIDNTAWAYSAQSSIEQRKAFINKLFGEYLGSNPAFDDIALNILTDFTNDGFMLLPYMVKYTSEGLDNDPKVLFQKATTPIKKAAKAKAKQEKVEGEADEDIDDIQECKYYKDLLALLQKCILNNSEKSVFTKKAKYYCIKELRNLFKTENSNGLDRAIANTWLYEISKDNKYDKTINFFFEVFDYKQIKGFIKGGENNA